MRELVGRTSCSHHPSALAALLFVLVIPARASAQSCCAGSGALTPGRLELHEKALIGGQIRAAGVLGSYDAKGAYTGSPSGTSELDFEQDLYGAVRVFDQGQLALLVPFVETRRQAQGVSELGGGVGDINASARYDFYNSGRSKYIPGIAMLAGLTLPTGRAVEASSRPLATDATGIGTLQGNIGMAVEQTYGHWLVNGTFLVAKRVGRTVNGVTETLGTQFTALVATAYAFDNDAALALLASFTVEGQAVINGARVPDSQRRLLLVSLAGLWPLSDTWRLQGSFFLNPPVPELGRNSPATGGFTFGVLHSWS